MKRLLKLTMALAAAGGTLAASAAGPAINAIATSSVDKVSPPHAVSSPVAYCQATASFETLLLSICFKAE